MSLRRRFLNLVALNTKNGVYSLRRIDLSRQHLFYETPAPPNDAAAERRKLDRQEMETIRIPAPTVRFRTAHCFGLSESKIVCTDNSGLSFLYDAGLRCFAAMPSLRAPKRWPISFSVPDADQDGGESLYVMERVPNPEPGDGEFEAFLYTATGTTYTKSWHRRSLPPPPCVLDPGYKRTPIDSHAVLGGGSHLCISAQGIGTYCFDTASREWTHAGDWTLPFFDKAEYVPELGLWFGLSEKDLLPCASDLSSVLKGRKPALRNLWRYHYPPEWNSRGMTKVVNLGSGRFCIVKFFETILEDTYTCFGEPVVDETFGVFTGVELLASRGHGDDKLDGNGSCRGSGNGKGKRAIRMVNHMSKLHMPVAIEDVL